MLNFDIKKKINTLRDILVGKVPDPKAQVEQITIAMMYKFMDDMDLRAAKWGSRKFFQGEYEKYAWSHLMQSEKGRQERASLYAEGIEKMASNVNIPTLFRDIFKGTYITYRDPNTLNMFLDEIDEFNYENSEVLGSAFEHLLSIMQSQGDAGQFRTPRDIIDMMVEIVQPKKNETVLDPSCGTAGFLISSYKHILENNKNKDGQDARSPDERIEMNKNFSGYDISPDMVRLARVNMYLNDFTNPKIYEYDTLTSLEKWDENFDVILANPPFTSPKGGIKPHSNFILGATRSEVLFVDYIFQHLNSKGRAGIIVQESFLKNPNSYQRACEYIVKNNFLYAVISLPSGVFHPYAEVGTAILLFDKTIANKKDDILFLEMSNDWYNLGTRHQGKNLRQGKNMEIDDIIKIVKSHQQGDDVSENPMVTMATKLEISEKNYNLIGHRYKAVDKLDYSIVEMSYIESYQKIIDGAKQIVDNHRTMIQINPEWEKVKLGDVCIVNPSKTEVQDLDNDTMVSFVLVEDINKNKMLFTTIEEKQLGEVYGGYSFFKDYDLLLPAIWASFKNGKSALAKDLKNGIGFCSNTCFVLRAKECILPEILYCYINSHKFIDDGKRSMGLDGSSGLRKIKKKFLIDYTIALPPLDVQHKIASTINEEIAIVDQNRQLIEIYEKKKKDKINQILWKQYINDSNIKEKILN